MSKEDNGKEKGTVLLRACPKCNGIAFEQVEVVMVKQGTYHQKEENPVPYYKKVYVYKCLMCGRPINLAEPKSLIEVPTIVRTR